MTVTVLLTLSLLFLILGVGVVCERYFAIVSHRFVPDDKRNGHEEVKLALFAILRILLRKLNYFRRLSTAYVLHVWVRILRFFDRFSFYLYARSRNLFVESAIKNKGTVPHFWDQLKTYKQEMDREREKEENE